MGLQKFIKDTTDNMQESQVWAPWLWDNEYVHAQTIEDYTYI